MVLPLVFSYSATILRKAASSSRTKPWSQYAVAVLAAALAMNGRPSVPAAANPTDPRRNERRLSSLMLIPLYFILGPRSAHGRWRSSCCAHSTDAPKCADWGLNATWYAGMTALPGTAGRPRALPPRYAGNVCSLGGDPAQAGQLNARRGMRTCSGSLTDLFRVSILAPQRGVRMS